MPSINIDIKREKDRYSSFGNTSKKGDIDKDNRITDEAINALVDYQNSYDGQLYQSTKEHAGEYLYIGEDGKIATKVALMDDLPDFSITGDHIEDESLTEAHIQPGSLTGAHFETDTFKNIPVGALQITQEHIGERAIREQHIGEDITNNKLAKGAIGKDNLQQNIILPEHIADEGIPLRCLPEFGTAYYLKYEANEEQEKEKPIQYFVVNNPENYSVVIENRGCYRFTVLAENKEQLEDAKQLDISALPNYVLSLTSIYQNEDDNDDDVTLALLTRSSENAVQKGYGLYSLPRMLNTTEDDSNIVCNYYYDDYFIIPLSNPTFYRKDIEDDINDGVVDLFNLKVNKVQPVNEKGISDGNENNIINNFSNSGFVKIYISKNTNGDIIL